MNPDLANAPSSPQIQNPKSKIENAVSSGHKRNGKIARLPKTLRDKINQYIDDGRTYPQIIKELGDDAKDLKPKHFSEWRKGGYEDYLRHQQWRDQLRILRENGSDMSGLTDGPKFQETLIQIALTEIFRVLQDHELKPDSLNYIRLFNALARLNREALGLRKYNDHLAKEQAQLKQLDLNRELVENEHIAIVDRTDRIMEMPRPRGTKVGSVPPREVGRGVLTATPDRLSEPAPVSCPPSPSNSSSPLPSRPCRAETPDPAHSRLAEISPSPRAEGRGKGNRDIQQPTTHNAPSDTSSIQNPKGTTSLVSKIEHCLDCRSPLPPIPPHSLRRPEDHCPNPNCGMRLPDIGLCYQPGFDHCLNCGATQPALLPGGERPRPNCHKCGERLHNPELPA